MLLKSMRSSRGFASISALALVASMCVVGLIGSGMSTSLLAVLPGGAWLASTVKGEIVLADGASGNGVARAVVPGTKGTKMSVVHRGGFACVRSEATTGEVSVNCVDDATFDGAGTTKVKASEEIVRTGDAAYMIEAAKGRVRNLDTSSLAPVGEALTFDAPITATPDDDGRLLVVELESSMSFVVSGGQASEPVRVGTKKGDLFPSLVNGEFAVVAQADSQVTVFSDGTVDRRVELPGGLLSVLVPSEVEGTELAMLSRGKSPVEVVTLHLGTGKGRRVRVRGVLPRASSVYSTSAGLFVPDVGSGKVTMVNTRSGATNVVDLGIGKGQGNIEMFVKDDQLWANNPNGSKAVVIDSQGKKREVNKYDPAIKGVDPGWAEDPAPVAPAGEQTESSPAPTATTLPPKLPPPGVASTSPPLSAEPTPTPSPRFIPVGPPQPDVSGGGTDEVVPKDVAQPRDPDPLDGDTSPQASGAEPEPPAEKRRDEPKAEEGSKAPPEGPNSEAPPAPQAPSRPVGFQGLAADRSIVLSWLAPVGESPPSSYELTCDPNCGGSESTVSVPSGTTTRELTKLRNGSPYAFSLIAVNEAGRSEAAIVANLRPVNEVPSPPPTVDIQAGIGGTLMVSWEEGDGEGYDVVGYDTTLIGDDGSEVELRRTSELSVEGVPEEGIELGVSYSAAVATISSASSTGATSDRALSDQPATAYSTPAGVALRVVRSGEGPKTFELHASPSWQGRVGTVRLGSLGSGERSGSGELTFDAIDPAWGTQGQVTVEACVADDEGQEHCVAGTAAEIDARAPVLRGAPVLHQGACVQDPNRPSPPNGASWGRLYEYGQVLDTYGVPPQFFVNPRVDWTYWRAGRSDWAQHSPQPRWVAPINGSGTITVFGGWGQDTDRYFVTSYVTVQGLGDIGSPQADGTVVDCPEDGDGRGN